MHPKLFDNRPEIIWQIFGGVLQSFTFHDIKRDQVYGEYFNILISFGVKICNYSRDKIYHLFVTSPTFLHSLGAIMNIILFVL